MPFSPHSAIAAINQEQRKESVHRAIAAVRLSHVRLVCLDVQILTNLELEHEPEK